MWCLLADPKKPSEGVQLAIQIFRNINICMGAVIGMMLMLLAVQEMVGGQ